MRLVVVLAFRRPEQPYPSECYLKSEGGNGDCLAACAIGPSKSEQIYRPNGSYGGQSDSMSPSPPTNAVFEIRVQGRRLVSTHLLVEAQWAVRATAQAGKGAEIVDRETGQVIERHSPQARSGSPD
jgi:hypothetical protein